MTARRTTTRITVDSGRGVFMISVAAELAEIEAAGHPAPREREEDLARLDAWVSDGQGPPGDAILWPPDR